MRVYGPTIESIQISRGNDCISINLNKGDLIYLKKFISQHVNVLYIIFKIQKKKKKFIMQNFIDKIVINILSSWYFISM